MVAERYREQVEREYSDSGQAEWKIEDDIKTLLVIYNYLLSFVLFFLDYYS